MQTLSFEDIIKIQRKGIMTIPKKAREVAGLAENGFARVRAGRRGVFVEPVSVLPYPVRTYTKEELEEFVRFDEEQSKELRRLKLLP